MNISMQQIQDISALLPKALMIKVSCNPVTFEQVFPRCGALRDLVLFVQFKKREKHPLRSVNFSKVEKHPVLKLTLLHGCFSRFLN